MRARIITLSSASRLEHLLRQLDTIERLGEARPIVVWLGADAAPAPVSERSDVLAVPPGPNGMRLAAARNRGADRAVADGAELLVFLDVDCLPGDELVARYRAAASAPGVLCGPVTYLPPEIDTADPAVVLRARSPHPARPDPVPGDVLTATAEQYDLFWSLSFAVTASGWRDGPRFDERYEGYGGEDTDFAYALREAGVPLRWIGGADAFHQWHETSTPPWAHLDDILRNGALFAERWGRWPMTGWLRAFESEGAVSRDPDGGWRAVPAPR